MRPPHVRRPRPRALARLFERSRLEPQLVAAAYELAVPVIRRALPPTPGGPPAPRAAGVPTLSHAPTGG